MWDNGDGDGGYADVDDGHDGDDKFYGDDIEYAQFPDSRSTWSLLHSGKFHRSNFALEPTFRSINFVICVLIFCSG